MTNARRNNFIKFSRKIFCIKRCAFSEEIEEDMKIQVSMDLKKRRSKEVIHRRPSATTERRNLLLWNRSDYVVILDVTSWEREMRSAHNTPPCWVSEGFQASSKQVIKQSYQKCEIDRGMKKWVTHSVRKQRDQCKISSVVGCRRKSVSYSSYWSCKLRSQ